MRKLTLTVTAAVALTAAAQAQNENIYAYPVGDYKVYLLSEGQSDGNPSILIGAGEEILGRYIPTGTYPSAVNTFLVVTPDKNVLIDAGFGRNLFDNLDAVGTGADGVDEILLTHMHGDHIGGMLREGTPAFPGAKVIVARAERDYWSSDTEMAGVPENGRGSFLNARRVFDAYAGLLETVEPFDIAEVPAEAGIYPVRAYGHTPGHTGFMVVSRGARLLIWGDLTHVTPVQMPHPEIAVTYDVDPAAAIATRRQIMRYAAEQGIPVAGMHIAYPGIGTLAPDGATGYRFTPAE
ncbi:MAG: MBL fold metallo-hydrolase [Rikenellaceae bacterium]|nr:MBL fold metallo-hydrolase [Rikenellaceae bacterium]